MPVVKLPRKIAPVESEPTKNVWWGPAVMSSGENPFGNEMVAGRSNWPRPATREGRPGRR